MMTMTVMMMTMRAMMSMTVMMMTTMTVMMIMTMTVMMSKVTKAQSGSWERRPWGERPTELDASSDWVRFEIARKICFLFFSVFLLSWLSEIRNCQKNQFFCFFGFSWLSEIRNCQKNLFFVFFFSFSSFLIEWDMKLEISQFSSSFESLNVSIVFPIIIIRWEPAVRPTMARRQSTIGVIVDSEFRVSRTSPSQVPQLTDHNSHKRVGEPD